MRSLASLLSLLLLVALAIATPLVDGDVATEDFVTDADFDLEDRAAPCPKGVYLIAIRGNGVNNPPFGIVTPLVDDFLKAIPGSQAVPISYPKNLNPSAAMPIAVANAKKKVANFVKKCPKGKIVIAGYSEGGDVSMNLACGIEMIGGLQREPPLEQKYLKNIVGWFAYADSNRSFNAPWNRGSCRGGSVPPRLNTRTCMPFQSVLRSYCNDGDEHCCAGTFEDQAHFTYFRKYDAEIIRFTKQNLKKRRS